jgi:hypothetical protein
MSLWSIIGQSTITLVKEPWYFALGSFEYKVFKLILNLTDSIKLSKSGELRDVT